MANDKDIRNQKELNKLLQEENKLLKKRIEAQSESFDLSASMVDSIKEVMGINSKRSTFDSTLLSTNKKIAQQVLKQRQDLTEVADLGKVIKQNSDLIAQSKVLEAGLAKRISDEGLISVNNAKAELGQIEAKEKLLAEELAKTKELGGVNFEIVESLQQQISKHDENVDSMMEGLSTAEKQLLFAKKTKEELEKQQEVRKKQLALEDKVTKKMGAIGGIADGISGSLNKMGMGKLDKALGIGDAVKSTRDMVRANKGNVSSMKSMKHLGKGMMKNLSGMASKANIYAIAIKLLVDAFIKLDKMSGDVAKNMGVSLKEGQALVDSMNDVASTGEGVKVTTKQLVKGQMEMNAALGTAVEFSGEMAVDYALIQARTGLSAKAMSFLTKEGLKNGKGIKESLRDISKTTTELNAQTGLSLSYKQVQESVAKVSNRILLSSKGNLKELTKQVFAAKSLGAEMSQLNSIADSLLDFESSIQAELEAELLTGKELSLEKARQAALDNDMVTLANEVKKNVGSAAEFGKMGRIQQEAIAKSVGMQADELANILNEQESLEAVKKAGFDSASDVQKEMNRLVAEGMSVEEASAEMKKKGLDDALIKQMESETKAEKMARMQEKFMDMIMQIADALMPIVDAIFSVLDPILKALAPIFKVIGDIIGLVVDILQPALDYTVMLFENIGKMFDQYFGGLFEVIENIKNLFVGIFTGDTDLIMDALGGIARGLMKMIISPVQFVLDMLFGIINIVLKGINNIPGVDIDLLEAPDLAALAIDAVGLAEGGIVTEPTQALIGEGGEPEAVVPLSKAKDLGFGGSNAELIEKIDQLIRINTKIAAKSDKITIEMSGNKVGENIQQSERAIQ